MVSIFHLISGDHRWLMCDSELSQYFSTFLSIFSDFSNGIVWIALKLGRIPNYSPFTGFDFSSDFSFISDLSGDHRLLTGDSEPSQ